jgi:hypothetical protein
MPVENQDKLVASDEYRVDKRATVFCPNAPLSGDILDGIHSTPQSGVRMNYDYPSGI